MELPLPLELAFVLHSPPPFQNLQEHGEDHLDPKLNIHVFHITEQD